MFDAFVFFLDAIVSGFAWFTQVFATAGLLDIFSGIMIISLVFYRLIAPMMRSAGSDRAKRRKENDNG